jgi:hypothetical protein
MLRRIPLLAGLLLLALPACAAFERAPAIDPRIAAEVTVDKAEPSPTCGYLGPIKGGSMVGDLGDAHGEVVRRAVLRGGNYVSIDLLERPMVAGVGGYTLHGRLFLCPKKNGEPQPPAPTTTFQAPRPMEAQAPAAAPKVDQPVSVSAPKVACEPECSPGFACVHGACVTACNPACGNGQQCGTDRTCHVASRE